MKSSVAVDATRHGLQPGLMPSPTLTKRLCIQFVDVLISFCLQLLHIGY